MAEVLLTQAVNQAEEAIESGNYGGAIETCQRILGQFPEFAGAHRIMGDAYAEQGELEPARQAYQRTLERDPQSIPAHLGLGMLAEDAGDREIALAYFQVAWEIDPRRRDLREHVSRVSQQLYGADGRLYLTRAALASLHFHAGRWDRAVSESAQVLQEYSTRVDVQARLGEALWRRGDDQQARQVCTTVLRSLPQAVVPLLILADIHRREGDRAGAEDFLEQARDIDPDGVRAADLFMIGFDDQAEFLSVDSIPTIDDQLVQEEPARYAPAPDFTAADAEDLAPVEEARQQDDTVAPAQAEDMPDLSSMEPPGVQPFRWEDIGDEDLEISDLDFQPPSAEPASYTPDSRVSDDFSLPTDEEIDRARPAEEPPSGYTNMLESLDSAGVEPFDPFGDEQPSQAAPSIPSQPPESPGPETAPEIPQDQAARSDDLVDEFSLPSEPEPSEEPQRGEAEVATPSEEGSDSPWEIDELGQGSPFELDWSRIDEEIQGAVPGEMPRGYTDHLRELDDVGVQPFAFEESSTPGEEPGSEEFAEPTDVDAGDVDSEPDEMFDEWEEVARETDELTPLPDQLGEQEPVEFDSIDVLFGGEDIGEFAQTEPLRADRFDSEDEFFSLSADAEPDEPADAGDEWKLDEGLEELIAEADSAGPDWPSAEAVDTPSPSVESDVFEQAADDSALGEVSRESSPMSAVVGLGISAERVGLDEALVERAREAKRELVESGVITGTTPIVEVVVPTFSLEALRDAVQSDPLDIEAQLSLASALISDQPDEALEQYRWIYRNAPERAVDIVKDLVRLIDVMREREVGVHRLLGALYRRHGDWAAASRHYEESLVGKRRRESRG
jgi:tetratricopeptide (TPR) repeat protein